eukprot:6183683-Pleurochrysis_carterae.AAC.1
MSHALPAAAPEPTLACICKVILHAQRSAEVPVVARGRGDDFESQKTSVSPICNVQNRVVTPHTRTSIAHSLQVRHADTIIKVYNTREMCKKDFDNVLGH